jgi:predicted AlkP superfamily pyrophosphatase or phosphodiesterase
MLPRPPLRPFLAALLLVAFACAGDGRPAPEDSRAGGATAAEPSGGINAERHLDAPHVVLVSFDGLGAERWGRYATPNLERVAAAGARAERMIPVYPTKTFPTHYSIATGMYADRHGLVGNRFWAPDLGASYALSDRESVEDGRFYRGEPIWVTAERQGMVAASFFFIGTEAPVMGIQPTYWHRFDAAVPHERRVDEVLGWLAMPPETRPRMITLYFEDVDRAWHFTGPDSPETTAAVARVDGSLGRLLDGIDSLPHGDSVYLILVSDHGLMGTPPTMVDEIDMARFPGVRMAEGGPYASLFIDEGGAARGAGLRDSLAAHLPESDVWLREDVPERLHYSADARIGDIVISAAPGRRVHERGRVSQDEWSHGWDNAVPEMSALFIATGPGIAPGQLIPPFEAIHVYPLLAHLLGLEPSPDIDGRLDVLLPILER